MFFKTCFFSYNYSISILGSFHQCWVSLGITHMWILCTDQFFYHDNLDIHWFWEKLSTFNSSRTADPSWRMVKASSFLMTSLLFPTPEAIRGMGTSFRRNSFSTSFQGFPSPTRPTGPSRRGPWERVRLTISGIVWVEKRYIWLRNGCLEYHRPIITDACPPKRSQESLHLACVRLPGSAVGTY